jgi:hypothetical protein
VSASNTAADGGEEEKTVVGDAQIAPVTSGGTKRVGQSLAEYIELQLAQKMSTKAKSGPSETGAATDGPMAAMRRVPVKPGEAQDHRPTVSEVLAADAQRQNFRELKWKEKQGLTRYGVTAGRNTKGKHRKRTAGKR